jgi:hypothetical protein
VHSAPPAGAVELAVGSLTISVPADPAGVNGSITAGSTVSVNLGTTTVTDTRAVLSGWTVTADATAPVDSSSHTIAKTRLSWTTTNLAAVTGLLSGVTVGGGGTFGATPVTVATAAGGAGGGTYTYKATVTLTVPANTYAATYHTTITQTVV